MKKEMIKIKRKSAIKSDAGRLSQQYDLWSYFMDNTSDVIYFKDKQGRFIFANKTYARKIGLRPEQIVGKVDADIFPSKRFPAMIAGDQYVLATGKSIINKIEKAGRSRSTDRYIAITKIPRYNQSGEIIGLMGIVRDMTQCLRDQRIKKEQTLKILEGFNRERTEFVAAVSHELRTPLAVMNQLFLCIDDETVGPLNDQQREIMVKIRHNFDRQKGIVDKMLDISGLEGKDWGLDYSLVNINSLLEDLKDCFQGMATAKDITINYALPKEDINIFIDASRIIQVITNLINNAIKFTGEKGSITVEVKPLGDKVRLGVIDTGIGIAPTDMHRIFDKFVQLPLHGMVKRQGIGLGLTIAKKLVEKHHGAIWVESELGMGSKFYFTLPRFYATDILAPRVETKIRQLAQKHQLIYLVNLLIVDWKILKKRIDIKPKVLFEALRQVVELAYTQLFGAKRAKGRTLIADIQKGKYSIILHQATTEEVSDFCELLKRETKDYFVKNEIKNVFIVLGILSYSPPPREEKRAEFKASHDVQVKEIYIGSQMRRSKRIHYKTTIELISPPGEQAVFETLNLSRHGVCFISQEPLKTTVGSKIRVAIALLRKKKTISAAARVAWTAKLGDDPQALQRYKTGLEFITMGNEDYKNLCDELNLYYE